MSAAPGWSAGRPSPRAGTVTRAGMSSYRRPVAPSFSHAARTCLRSQRKYWPANRPANACCWASADGAGGRAAGQAAGRGGNLAEELGLDRGHAVFGGEQAEAFGLQQGDQGRDGRPRPGRGYGLEQPPLPVVVDVDAPTGLHVDGRVAELTPGAGRVAAVNGDHTRVGEVGRARPAASGRFSNSVVAAGSRRNATLVNALPKSMQNNRSAIGHPAGTTAALRTTWVASSPSDKTQPGRTIRTSSSVKRPSPPS